MNENLQASILIVDDNIRNLQILANILRDHNYKVAMVKDGMKALKFIKKKTPDLILLDVMMPKMDGFEVCRHLKTSSDTKNIPIIFISALHETEDKIKAFESGGVDYITKPFHKEEVVARVRTHMELQKSREFLKIAYRKLQKAYEEMDRAARTDILTKLSNRRDIIEKLKYEKTKFGRSQKPFALILADIDDFKYFNDEYGHDCGDFILESISAVIQSSVRKQDSAARWGGEEFLLLLPETSLNGGFTVAEKIRQRLTDQVFEYGKLQLSATMTFGISIFSASKTIDKCIKQADEAMYQGKKAGKNRVVCFEKFK